MQIEIETLKKGLYKLNSGCIRLFAEPVSVVRVAAPSPETSAKTPTIAVQPALLNNLVQDQDLTAKTNLFDSVRPVAADADHAWCLAALVDDLAELGVAGEVSDVETMNVRGSLAAPQLQINGAIEHSVVLVGGVVLLAWVQPEAVVAWDSADAEHVVGLCLVPVASDVSGRAFDGVSWALADQRVLLWLVDALRSVHAVRNIHGHHVEAALAITGGLEGWHIERLGLTLSFLLGISLEGVDTIDGMTLDGLKWLGQKKKQWRCGLGR